jgi:hypothetical protein
MKTDNLQQQASGVSPEIIAIAEEAMKKRMREKAALKRAIHSALNGRNLVITNCK